MRAFSLGLLTILILTGSIWALNRQTAESKYIDIAIADDGTMYIAGEDYIINGSDTVFAKDLKGLQSIKAWKNILFFLQNGELYQAADPKAIKKLISKEQLKKLSDEPLEPKAVAFDANGQQYLIACNAKGQAGIIRRSQQGNLSLLIPPGAIAELVKPVSMTVGGESSLLVQCEGQTACNIVCLMQKKVIGTILLGKVTSLTYDHFGRLYAVDTANKRVVVQTDSQSQPAAIIHEFEKVVAIAYSPKLNKIVAVDAGKPEIFILHKKDTTLGTTIDESPLSLKVAPAFPNIEWAGWEPVNDKGIAVPLRPLLLTHANDNSGRNFVGTEYGVVYVFPNKPDVKETKVFLDIQKQVSYKDSQNEEGFLGLAFHPKYKENGEFFVNYTRKPGLLTVVSRFKVSKDDPNKADPASEEVLFTLKKPMWNHSGGTICFGPDGYLYVVFGDGGGANDMFKNSRKMDTFHSKIIRIDVDSKSDGKAYGIPKDNPFVGKAGFAPEIFCYGVRNPWRMSFDRKTGQGWFADVGQNLYEEINLLQKGGDYGWSHRESFHPFGPNSLPVNDKMIEPIWEYNHLLGKSITGGFVYRGKQFPELDGWYLYADYVSARIWALKYDFDKKRVVANREIANRGLPIMSFGEDEDGELYLMTFSASGQGIDRIVRK